MKKKTSPEIPNAVALYIWWEYWYFALSIAVNKGLLRVLAAHGRFVHKDFKLTILHVNDIHAHFDQMNVYTGRCHQKHIDDRNCYGGAARLYTKVKEIRDRDPEHTLVLNAGDYYQGTIWYTIFKEEPMIEFANFYNYTAMAVGNHDFDGGIGGLVPFIDQVNFPVLAANLDDQNVPELRGKIKKSVVIEIESRKVGLIGYVTQKTPKNSHPGKDLIFLDELETVGAEAERLRKEEKVDIIIGVGHSGYDIDRRLARKIPELDAIIGAHSHSFLFTESHDNPLPSIEESEGPYPTYVEQKSGKVVPVVQAYCHSKYLGYIELSFDLKGELRTPVNGVGVPKANPILLDFDIPQEPAILAAMQRYRVDIREYDEVHGTTAVDLLQVIYCDADRQLLTLFFSVFRGHIQ